MMMSLVPFFAVLNLEGSPRMNELKREYRIAYKVIKLMYTSGLSNLV